MSTLVIIASISMTACSTPVEIEGEKTREEISKITKENEELKEEILKLQQNKQELEEELEEIEEEITKPDLVITENETLFNLYGANIDTYEREIINHVVIKDNLDLKDKLDILAQGMSRARFDGLGIEIVEIRNEDNKKIAVVDLTEVPNEKDTGWSSIYFQGSTGGIITSMSLEETFLQRDYDGEWIDGVEFLYQGEQVDFSHMESFWETIYR